MSEEVRKITAVAAEDSCQSRMNHARPTLTPKQRAQYRRVAVVVLESARKRSDATRLRAQQMPEVAEVDLAAADVAKAAGNPVRSARLRQESATRRLIPCHEEDHLAHHVSRRSLLVLPAVAGAAAAELLTNAEGACDLCKSLHILIVSKIFVVLFFFLTNFERSK